MSWFNKKPVPKVEWYEIYTFSCPTFTQDDKLFLAAYTEEGFNKILGDDYFINSYYRIHLSEYLEAVYHFINTGEKKYFYTHDQDKRDIKKENKALRLLVSELLKDQK